MSFLDVLIAVLVSGSITGSVGFAIGLGLRPGLVLRVNDYIHTLIKQEIDNFTHNLNENPKFVQELLNPFITAITKEFGAEGGGEKGPKDLKIGGFKIPAWLVQLGVNQFLQTKRNPALPPGLEELMPR